jgi:uncharacterized protein (DUF58 family)
MLTKEGALLVISIASWMLLISILIFQPFLLLTVFFLHVFLAFYVIASHKLLKRVRPEDLVLERSIEMVRGGGDIFLRVGLTVAMPRETRLYAEASDDIPRGVVPEGRLEPARGWIGGDARIRQEYSLRVPAHAGLVRFATASVRIHDPLRLTYRVLRLPAAGDVAIPLGEETVASLYTQLSSVSRPPLGMGVRSMIGYDDEFAGVKQYDEADKMRDIHWLRYAQQVEEDYPVAKKYRKRGEVSFHIVVDCSPSINLGKERRLVEDIATLVRQVYLSADEEGNPVHLWLVNPLLTLEEKALYRKTASRVVMERYISRITPAPGRDDGRVAEFFARRVGRGSVVLVVVNPPSQNLRVVERMIRACPAAGASCIVVMPDLSSYLSDGELDRRLLAIDRAYKESWLRGVDSVDMVLELRRGEVYVAAERVLRRR